MSDWKHPVELRAMKLAAEKEAALQAKEERAGQRGRDAEQRRLDREQAAADREAAAADRAEAKLAAMAQLAESRKPQKVEAGSAAERQLALGCAELETLYEHCHMASHMVDWQAERQLLDENLKRYQSCAKAAFSAQNTLVQMFSLDQLARMTVTPGDRKVKLDIDPETARRLIGNVKPEDYE